MKKVFFKGIFALALVSAVACERSKNNQEDADRVDDDKRVVRRDSVATEYEVTETVVEYDTTQRTRKVKADSDEEVNRNRDNDNNDNDQVIEVKKDRD